MSIARLFALSFTAALLAVTATTGPALALQDAPAEGYRLVIERPAAGGDRHQVQTSAHHVMSVTREAPRRHASHISQAEDGHPHDSPPSNGLLVVELDHRLEYGCVVHDPHPKQRECRDPSPELG